MSDKELLNPEIKKISIGIKSLREVTIYPLSLGDELELTDLITESLQAYYLKGNQNDVIFISFLLDLVKRNLGKILLLVTENETEDVLKNITNSQAVNLAQIIVDVNFVPLSQSIQMLAEKMKTVLNLKKS
jgi:hypothetical protein